MKRANVVGAGLAGCEAAYQLAKRGVKVRFFEMKPSKHTPAHSSNDFCELFACGGTEKCSRTAERGTERT